MLVHLVELHPCTLLHRHLDVELQIQVLNLSVQTSLPAILDLHSWHRHWLHQTPQQLEQGLHLSIEQVRLSHSSIEFDKHRNGDLPRPGQQPYRPLEQNHH